MVSIVMDYALRESLIVYCFLTCLTLLDLCVSSLRVSHADLLCTAPIVTDDIRTDSICVVVFRLQIHIVATFTTKNPRL